MAARWRTIAIACGIERRNARGTAEAGSNSHLAAAASSVESIIRGDVRQPLAAYLPRLVCWQRCRCAADALTCSGQSPRPLRAALIADAAGAGARRAVARWCAAQAAHSDGFLASGGRPSVCTGAGFCSGTTLRHARALPASAACFCSGGADHLRLLLRRGRRDLLLAPRLLRLQAPGGDGIGLPASRAPA